ncbi:MAG: sigma-70 family RNA polymerase sigma factor [Planctomycetes bacterium]|nr:sigma-70 family RNA polymerase sigma factor [Planctomycetota bacterium]
MSTVRPMQRDLHPSSRLPVDGEARSLHSLFDECLPRLQAFLRVRMGPVLAAKESVSDLAQSVCREVLQDVRGIELSSSAAFRKWLFLQARRKLVDRKRYYQRVRRDISREAAERSPSHDVGVESMLADHVDSCTPSHVASARERVRRLELALAGLPTAQRDVITMVRLFGLSTADVATDLGVSQSAVRGLLARGLAQLAITLEHSGD